MLTANSRIGGNGSIKDPEPSSEAKGGEENKTGCDSEWEACNAEYRCKGSSQSDTTIFAGAGDIASPVGSEGDAGRRAKDINGPEGATTGPSALSGGDVDGNQNNGNRIKESMTLEQMLTILRGSRSEGDLCVHYCKGCDELIATHTMAEHVWEQRGSQTSPHVRTRNYCMACIEREERKWQI